MLTHHWKTRATIQPIQMHMSTYLKRVRPKALD